MSIPYKEEIAELNKFPVTVKSEEGTDSPVWVTYEEFVCSIVAPMDAKDNIHHMATGIAGEGGELLDCSKKTWVYKKPLDRANMIEELGDLEWYMAGLRQMLGVSRYEVLASNVAKLSVRYAAGYSDAAAIERADKVEVPLHVIDVTAVGTAKTEAIPQELKISEIAAADSLFGNLEPSPVVEPWVLPLLEAYHAGKTVQAISYTKNTATVLFVGDSNPYKLYGRPTGEVG